MQEEEMPEARFATRFRERREELGLSQTEVARELAAHGLKLDGTAITRIETRQRGVKLDEAVALAAVLRIPLRALIGDRDKWDVEDTDFVTGMYAELEALKHHVKRREAQLLGQMNSDIRKRVEGERHGQHREEA